MLEFFTFTKTWCFSTGTNDGALKISQYMLYEATITAMLLLFGLDASSRRYIGIGHNGEFHGSNDGQIKQEGWRIDSVSSAISTEVIDGSTYQLYQT